LKLEVVKTTSIVSTTETKFGNWSFYW